MKSLALLALCAYSLLFLPVPAASAFNVPEKLVYDVTWTGVKSATTVYEVSAKGDDLHMVSTTRSFPWMSSFFPVDDMAESILTRGEGARFGVPKYYRQKNSQGKHRSNREAYFDPVRLKVEAKDLIKKTEKTEAISARTYDSLSCIYFVRTLDLASGKPVFFEVYDGKRLWTAEVRILRREEVATPKGRFKTVVVRPLLRAGDGTTPKSGELTIWLTDDELRIPVMLVTKAKVGKITATLVGGSYWPER